MLSTYHLHNDHCRHISRQIKLILGIKLVEIKSRATKLGALQCLLMANSAQIDNNPTNIKTPPILWNIALFSVISENNWYKYNYSCIYWTLPPLKVTLFNIPQFWFHEKFQEKGSDLFPRTSAPTFNIQWSFPQSCLQKEHFVLFTSYFFHFCQMPKYFILSTFHSKPDAFYFILVNLPLIYIYKISLRNIIR